MKSGLWVFACLVSSTAVGQSQATSKEAARFVTDRADSVSWNPDGTFLGYTYRGPGGQLKSIGVYDLRNDRGKTLLTPEPGENFEQPVWLADNPIQIDFSTQSVTVSGKPYVRHAIWALNGKNLNAKKLWTEDFPKDDDANLSLEASPSLTHAIVTLKTKEGKAYYIITLGGQGMTLSPDISTAIQQGQGFAGWTVDGTAFFGGNSKNDLSGGNTIILNLAGSNGDAGGNSTAGEVLSGSVTLQVLTSSGSEISTALSEVLLGFVNNRPEIPSGAEGLELMPTNGVLRQVRFKGYWVDEDQPATPTALVPRDHSLSFKDSVAGTRALWLTANEKDPHLGVMVSPQAELAWLHPGGRVVAFTLNGVLFVKTIRQDAR